MSGIALFDEPPRVSIIGIEGMRNGLLLGMASSNTPTDLYGVVLVENGSVTYLSPSEFVLDWRYNPEIDQWVDVSMPKPEEV